MSSKLANKQSRITFILRLSPVQADGRGPGEIDWRGQLQDVQTGELTPFQGIGALSDLLRNKLPSSLSVLTELPGEKGAGLH